MYYGNQSFISNNNSGNVSHEISESNRLQTANSIITINISISGNGGPPNFYNYILNYNEFYYNNTAQFNWRISGDEYRIPESVGNASLEYRIAVELNDDD